MVPAIVITNKLCFAHFEILGFPICGASQYRDIFARFKTMRRKQNSASTIVRSFNLEKNAIYIALYFTAFYKYC